MSELTDEQIFDLSQAHSYYVGDLPEYDYTAFARAIIEQDRAQRQAEQVPDTQETILEAAELFQQLDALLKPHGWPAQKMLRNYVEMVKKVCIAAPQPAHEPLTNQQAYDAIAATVANPESFDAAVTNNVPGWAETMQVVRAVEQAHDITPATQGATHE